MDTYNKNGSHLQRRKLYFELPFNHFYSQLPLDWNPQPNQYRPLKDRERSHIEQTYNKLVDQQLSQKHYQKIINREHSYDNPSSPRVGVNQEERYRERESQEALSQQVEEMNHSRVFPPHHSPEHSPPRNPQHSPPPISHNLSMHLPTQSQLSPKPQRYGSASQIPLLPRPQLPIPRRLPHSFHNTPQLLDKDSISYPFRNAMPDRLQSFLRQQTKQNHNAIMNTYINNTRRQRQGNK